MSTQKRLLAYVLKYKFRLLLAGVCAVGMTGCTLFVAALIGWFAAVANSQPVLDYRIIRFGIDAGWFGPHQAHSALLTFAAVLLTLVHIPRAVFTYFNSYLVASVTNRIGADVRYEIYAHIQTLPLSFFHRSRVGDILSRMNNDVGLIQNSSVVVMHAIDGPLMVVGGLARMFMLNWQLAMLTIVFVPFMGAAIDRLTRRIRPLTTATQAALSDVSSTVEESIHGVRIVRAFGMEDYEVERFDRVNTHSLTTTLRFWRRNALATPVVELLGAAAASVVVLVGGRMVIGGHMTFPQLAEFTLIAFSVAAASKQFARLNVLYRQTLAAADRVFEILDTRSDLPEPADAVEMEDIRGRVEFREVCFEYNPGEPVLYDVSFRIDPGEILAIVGPSGAGKSTIADLIPRFYDVTSGQVLVDGQDVRRVRTASLRKHIAMVPQDTILFRGTIAENIAYGRPGAAHDEIVEVAKAANAHDFISEMPDGYSTHLGEGGVGLSGGQRQRIAIARALLRDPRILILDEATSSLDAASEGVVQDALDRLMRGRTTLVIAHRLSTVTKADRILVLDRGRTVESGRFDELVGGDGLFAQLYKTQFSRQTGGADQ
mgnify:CR=1 FL=1